MEKTMEKMTPQQAWEFVRDRRTQHLIGLDFADYIHFLLAGKGNEVTLLTYNLEEGKSLSETLKDNLPEIQEQSAEAMNMLMQLYCGKDYQLMMDDINELSWFVDSVTADGISFAWGLEDSDTTEYQLQICIFIVK